mgnify:CR=1 FL=1
MKHLLIADLLIVSLNETIALLSIVSPKITLIIEKLYLSHLKLHQYLSLQNIVAHPLTLNQVGRVPLPFHIQVAEVQDLVLEAQVVVQVVVVEVVRAVDQVEVAVIVDK